MTVIARRFCGPPDSANGGYTAGLLAAGAPGPLQVTLRAPPPLERPLLLEPGVRLVADEQLIAEARAAPLELALPPAPSFAEAEAAAAGYAGHHSHAFPTCFVCGPARAEGDGLRLFAGPRAGRPGQVAAPFCPHPQLAGPEGTLPPELLWAALDCPGYFALEDVKKALLGRITAEVRGEVRAGERCVVLGWRLGREGRKHFAATALWDAAGRLLGRSHQVWIEI